MLLTFILRLIIENLKCTEQLLIIVPNLVVSTQSMVTASVSVATDGIGDSAGTRLRAKSVRHTWIRL